MWKVKILCVSIVICQTHFVTESEVLVFISGHNGHGENFKINLLIRTTKQKLFCEKFANECKNATCDAWRRLYAKMRSWVA